MVRTVHEAVQHQPQSADSRHENSKPHQALDDGLSDDTEHAESQHIWGQSKNSRAGWRFAGNAISAGFCGIFPVSPNAMSSSMEARLCGKWGLPEFSFDMCQFFL
jgi:hypothetical protein